MNEPSRWRQAYARAAARVYADDPRVAAIVIGGSTGRGHADQWSDIELGVFWTHPPSDTDRSDAAAQIDGYLFRLYPYDQTERVWCDDFYLGNIDGNRNTGVHLEVIHMTTTSAEALIAAVVDGYDPDPTKQSTIAAIADSVIVEGKDLLLQWRSRIDPYPEALATAVVSANAQVDHFWRSEMWIDRGNNLLMLHASFVEVGLRLVHVLCGLNRVYFFGTKWIDVVIDRFDEKPTEFGQRLKKAFVLAPRDGAQLISELVEETYDLIEDSGLDVDVARLRSIFRFSRTPWGATPPQR